MLQELRDLAERFRDSGNTSYIMISACLFTILGANTKGIKSLYSLNNICAEFARSQSDELNN